MTHAADRTAASHARTVLLVACGLTFALLLWDVFAAPAYRGEVGMEPDDNPLFSTVIYVKPGYPADRARLRVGDVIDVIRSEGDTIPERIENGGRWLAGQPIVLHVLRAGKQLSVTVTPMPVPPSDTWTNTDFWTDIALDTWMLVFAAIVAWRGVDQRARLLSWVLVLLVAADLLGPTADYGFLTPWHLANVTAFMLQIPAAALAPALFVFVASTFGRPLSTARRALTYVTYAAITISALMQVIWVLDQVFPQLDAIYNFLTSYNQLPISWMFGIAVGLVAACAFAAVAATQGGERQRSSWLMIPFGVYFLIGAVTSWGFPFAGGPWTGARTVLGITSNVAAFFTPALLTYAVLRRRLLDVNFVVNRAAVFAGVSAVVIGAFIFAEWLLNKVFVESSRTTNTLIGLGIALALGLSLRFIHRYVDRIVDRLFFRKRHEHEHALRSFAHEAAYITDYDTLLDATVSEVSTDAETDRVSILVRDNDGTYTTARGTNGAMDRIHENDRAVLKMRSWHTPVDLDGVETALDGAWAYPLMSRGDLVGILVCGARRDGQGYAPDESEALSHVAQGVGSALGNLRRSDGLSTDVGDIKATMCEVRDALRMLVNEQREMREKFGYSDTQSHG